MPAETEPAVMKDPRRHDLDALRAFAMLLGIALHAALSFFAVPVWMVQDQRPIAGIETAVSAVHGFRMPLFFLISGFFTAMLWKRRGMSGLLTQRTKRIAIPLAIGCATIVPLMFHVMSWASMRSGEAGAPAAQVATDATIWSASLEGDAETVRAIAERDGSFDLVGGDFYLTPLGYAALGGHAEAARVLLEAGANPNLTYGEGSTPMHTAGFLGRAQVAEHLLAHGADVSIQDNRGGTPLDAMNANEMITKMIGGFLKIPIDFAEISAGRDQIRATLAAQGVEEQPSAGGRSAKAVIQGLMSFPFFHHLWFLWHLCLLVVGFAVAALVADRLPVLRRFPRVLIATPLCLLWLVPLTMSMQWFMSARGTMSGFGPDTSAGLVPMPHVLGYYAVFFGFGAVMYSRQGAADRLGRGWWLMLPAAMVLLPFALSLGYQSESAVRTVPDAQTRHLLSALAQVLYAWLMTFGLMGLFEAVLSKERAWVRWVSDSSYWLYLIHLPLIIAGQALLARTDAPGWLKMSGLLVVTTVVLLLSYRFLVRYTPIGWMLNGRRVRPIKTVPATAP